TELDPDNADWQLALAGFYDTQQRYQEAENIYRTLMQRPEYQADAYLSLASQKMKQDQRFQAISILEEGAQRTGDSEKIKLQLGKLYASIGEDERALKIFIDLEQRNPENLEVQLLAAESMVNLGRTAEAREKYLKILSLNPDNEIATKELKRLEGR